jgi:uncharacterized membrane protein YjjP (DUF1212 family)
MMVPVPTIPTDDELELIRQSGVALRAGKLSLSAGTGSYRVKNTMERVATALGIDRHEAHVTLTEITTTSHRGSSFRTEVAEVRSIGINSDRLSALEVMASTLRPGSTVEEVTEKLDAITARRPLYSGLLNALWSAIACAAFAFLNNGGPIECLVVFIGAGVGQYVRRALLTRGFNQFGVTMIAAAAACLTYLGFVQALQAVGSVGAHHQAGYISAVLFLVPGFPLVTGSLDLAKLDFSAGLARLTYALMILSSAALAVWGVSVAAGLDPAPVAAPPLPFLVLIALRLVASFLGVLGFALMFNSPWKMAIGAALVGMVANVVRIQLVEIGAAAQAGAAAAALIVGLLSAWVAPRLRVPRITIYVPAVVIMVPGATAYRSVFHLSNGDTTQALAFGVQAALVVIAISIGLAVGRMLTDATWAYER